MRKYLDLDIKAFVVAPGSQVPDQNWSFYRGEDGEAVELSFVRGGVIVELPGDAAGSLVFKEAGKRDGDALTNASSWAKSGTGEETVYSFAADFDTDPANELLAHDEDAENDVLSAAIEGQVLWTSGGKTFKSPIIEGTLIHDVNHGTEGTPASEDPALYYTAEQTVKALYLAGLTGGGSTKLDGISTVAVSVPRLFYVIAGDSISTYVLRAGTEAEASPGIIRPDDYASGTNEKVYVQLG